jgi:DNA (cytosine-5)-methyltransferase 1
MKLATIFSGIGAPEQAMHRIDPNFKTVFACEWDKFARQSYSAIYNIDEAHFYKDVHDMYGTQYRGEVDILVGGSPCQAFSIAGLRNGTNDERGQLIYQYIRIVDEVKSPVIVYENVKGMLSISNGNTIKEFVQALRDIGYHCHYEVVNTKDYGVPQNRERIFLIGFLDHDAYLRFSFAPKQKLEKRLKDVLESEVDEKYYLSKKFIEGSIAHKERHQDRGNGFAFDPKSGDDICGCIATKYGNRQTDTFIDVIGLLDCKGSGIQEISPKIGAMRGHNPQNPKSRSVGLETTQMLEINENGTSNCLTTVQKDNLVIEQKIQVHSATKCGYELAESGDSINLSVPNSTTRRGRVGKQVAQTLDTQCNQAVVTNRIRKLTPLECWRLQDFSDEAHNKAKAVGVSDSQLYKQAGNSMSVNVLEMIFRQVTNGKNSDSLF